MSYHLLGTRASVILFNPHNSLLDIISTPEKPKMSKVIAIIGKKSIWLNRAAITHQTRLVLFYFSASLALPPPEASLLPSPAKILATF